MSQWCPEGNRGLSQTGLPPPLQPPKGHAMRLRPLQVIGYSAGDAANNLAFSITSFFLLVYYTAVAGVTAAAAGTTPLRARRWHAFAGVFSGRVVDRTQTRWG